MLASVTLVSTTVSLFSMPPPLVAVLPLTVTLTSVSVPLSCVMPPPPSLPDAVFPLIVTSLQVAEATFEIPPPTPSAVLPEMVTSFRVTLAKLSMAPPSATEWPFRIVSLEIVVFAKTSNTRSRPPPSTIVVGAPSPVIVSGALMSRSPRWLPSSPNAPFAIVSV